MDKTLVDEQLVKIEQSNSQAELKIDAGEAYIQTHESPKREIPQKWRDKNETISENDAVDKQVDKVN